MRAVPRKRIGKPMTAMISDTRITADAMKIATSRPASGVPLSSVTGSESTPASVTAPRTPPIVVMASVRKPGAAPMPCFAALRLATQRRQYTHTKRNAYNATTVAST